MQEPIKKNLSFLGKGCQFLGRYAAHRTRGNRLIIFVLGFLLLFSLSAYALAAGLYNPGDTNDPACAPGTLDCYVNVASTNYTFSTGLTNISGTVTDDLATGVAGGQTVIGGTNAGDDLILSSTSNSPKGYVGITNAARGTANFGSLSIGGGAFDGVTSGFFSGSISGTSLAVNEASGYVGNLADFQVGGISQFKVSDAGGVTANSVTLAGSTSGTLGVSANPTTTPYSLVLPATQGAAASVLQNDGAGNLSWGAPGITTLTAIGGAPNADGGSISGTTFTLQPADGTHGGVLTSGTQTIGGAKSFSSDILIDAGTYDVSAGGGPGSGANNVVFGYKAGNAMTTGGENSFVGDGSGAIDTTGGENVGEGFLSLANNTLGSEDTAIGVNSMQYVQDGNYNTALGTNAGRNDTHGSNNLTLGATGGLAGITTGSSNIVLDTYNGTNYGADNLTTGSNNIYIGAFPGTNTSNTVSLSDGSGNIVFYSPSSHNVIIPAAGTTSAPSDNGALFQIGGSLTASGSITFPGITPGVACNSGSDAVGYTSAGVLDCFSTLSDQRLKTNITPLSNTTGLAAIEQLQPVSYNWIDPTLPGTGSTAEQFGFIAQQVQNVLPNLVTQNAPTYLTPDVTYGLNYQGFTAVTVEAIQELDADTKLLQSIDPTQSGSLASLVVQFLQNATVTIQNLTVNTFNINGNVCVDEVCVTKAQFKQMLLNAGGTEGNTTGDLGTGSTGDISSGDADSTTTSDGTTTGGTASDATPGTTTNTNTTAGDDSGTAMTSDGSTTSGTTTGTTTSDSTTGGEDTSSDTTATTTGTTGGTGSITSGGDDGTTGTDPSGTTTGGDNSGTGSTGSADAGATTSGQ